METRSADYYKQYCRVKNKIRKSTRINRNKFEENISGQTKTDPKRIWMYVRSNLKVIDAIGAVLKNGQTNETTHNDIEKAEVLSIFSMFLQWKITASQK